MNKKIKQKNGKNALYSCLTGVVVGAINGLFGGGGGMVLVPMLERLLKVPAKNSHATALLIILPVSLVSGALYAMFGSYNLVIGLPVLIGTTLGGIIGAIALKKISSDLLMITFNILMIFAGIKLLF